MTTHRSESERGSITGTIRQMPRYEVRCNTAATTAQAEGVYDPSTDAWLSAIDIRPIAEKNIEVGKWVDDFIATCESTVPHVRAIVGEFAPDMTRKNIIDAAVEFYATRGFTLYVSSRMPQLVYVIKIL